MKDRNYEKIKKKLDNLEENIENMEIGEFQDQVYELEEEVNEGLREAYEEDEIDAFEQLSQRIQQIKKENDFYDPEAELDRMFPNRYDDDFDEDSMSYDSVFGGD